VLSQQFPFQGKKPCDFEALWAESLEKNCLPIREKKRTFAALRQIDCVQVAVVL
jgi:hypothetical protein